MTSVTIPDQIHNQLRFSAARWIGTATLGTGGVNLAYYHKQHPQLSFGVEWETNFRSQESLATIAYQAELPDEGVVMRGWSL